MSDFNNEIFLGASSFDDVNDRLRTGEDYWFEFVNCQLLSKQGSSYTFKTTFRFSGRKKNPYPRDLYASDYWIEPKNGQTLYVPLKTTVSLRSKTQFDGSTRSSDGSFYHKYLNARLVSLDDRENSVNGGTEGDIFNLVYTGVEGDVYERSVRFTLDLEDYAGVTGVLKFSVYTNRNKNGELEGPGNKKPQSSYIDVDDVDASLLYRVITNYSSGECVEEEPPVEEPSLPAAEQPCNEPEVIPYLEERPPIDLPPLPEPDVVVPPMEILPQCVKQYFCDNELFYEQGEYRKNGMVFHYNIPGSTTYTTSKMFLASTEDKVDLLDPFRYVSGKVWSTQGSTVRTLNQFGSFVNSNKDYESKFAFIIDQQNNTKDISYKVTKQDVLVDKITFKLKDFYSSVYLKGGPVYTNFNTKQTKQIPSLFGPFINEEYEDFCFSLDVPVEPKQFAKTFSHIFETVFNTDKKNKTYYSKVQQTERAKQKNSISAGNLADAARGDNRSNIDLEKVLQLAQGKNEFYCEEREFLDILYEYRNDFSTYGLFSLLNCPVNNLFSEKIVSKNFDKSLFNRMKKKPSSTETKDNILVFEDGTLQINNSKIIRYWNFNQDTLSSFVSDSGNKPENVVKLIQEINQLCLEKRRNYAQILNGDLCYSETMMYRIDRHQVNKDTGVVKETPNKSVYIWSCGKPDINYIDTMFPYDQPCIYRVFAYVWVLGNKIKFSVPQQNNNDEFYAFVNHTRSAINDLRLYEIHLYDTVEKILLDRAPPPPDFVITPIKDNKKEILIWLNSDLGTYDLLPIPLNQEELNQVLKQRNAQNRRDNKLEFRGDNNIAEFRIYKLSSKPKKISDFDGKFVSLKTSQNSVSSVEYTEKVIFTNKDYWYMFRVVDVSGFVSNPSKVLQVRMVEDDGLYYLEQKEYEIEQENKKFEQSFASKMTIKPMVNHTILDDSKTIQTGDLTKLSLGYNIEKPLWGKTFKMRITSKDTGRKIDLNFRFDLKNKLYQQDDVREELTPELADLMLGYFEETKDKEIIGNGNNNIDLSLKDSLFRSAGLLQERSIIPSIVSSTSVTNVGVSNNQTSVPKTTTTDDNKKAEIKLIEEIKKQTDLNVSSFSSVALSKELKIEKKGQNKDNSGDNNVAVKKEKEKEEEKSEESLKKALKLFDTSFKA